MMGLSTASLILSVFFGAIGSAYVVYGKRRMSAAYLVTGVLLVVYPYFVENPWASALIGIVLLAIPIALDRGLI